MWKVMLGVCQEDGIIIQHYSGLEWVTYEAAVMTAEKLCHMSLWDYVFVTNGIEEHTFPGR